MPLMRTHIQRSICRTGGSISRPPEEIYREAADIAYYFHWGRQELAEMNGKERQVWLKQINRIHQAQKEQRIKENEAQIKMIQTAKNEETE
jgi:hypothetical protein